MLEVAEGELCGSLRFDYGANRGSLGVGNEDNEIWRSIDSIMDLFATMSELALGPRP